MQKGSSLLNKSHLVSCRSTSNDPNLEKQSIDKGLGIVNNYYTGSLQDNSFSYSLVCHVFLI